MKFEVIINKNEIESIERVIIETLGEVPIHITRVNKVKYIIDVDYDITEEQRNVLESLITEIFETKELVVNFKVL